MLFFFNIFCLRLCAWGLRNNNNNKQTFIYRHLQENQDSSGLQIEMAYKIAWGLKMSLKYQQTVNADLNQKNAQATVNDIKLDNDLNNRLIRLYYVIYNLVDLVDEEDDLCLYCDPLNFAQFLCWTIRMLYETWVWVNLRIYYFLSDRPGFSR